MPRFLNAREPDVITKAAIVAGGVKDRIERVSLARADNGEKARQELGDWSRGALVKLINGNWQIAKGAPAPLPTLPKRARKQLIALGSITFAGGVALFVTLALLGPTTAAIGIVATAPLFAVAAYCFNLVGFDIKFWEQATKTASLIKLPESGKDNDSTDEDGGAAAGGALPPSE